MINDIVLPDMTLGELKAEMKKVRARIIRTLGVFPDTVPKPAFRIIRKYSLHNLEHWLIGYEVHPGVVCKAIMIFPEAFDFSRKAPCVMCMHGTTHYGKLGVASAEMQILQRSPYGVELAQRGYITISPDQYWFGDYWKLMGNKENWEDTFDHFTRKFYQEYPKWSMDGKRLWDMQRALDVVSTMKFVDLKSLGVIGNSLGGRSAIFIAAFDERIQAAVVSTGVSPNVTSMLRGAGRKFMFRQGSHFMGDARNIFQGCKPVYEYQEMMALCAPRALFMIEPFNDQYNAYISVALECFEKATKVYSLYNKPDHISMLVNGDGHGTVPYARESCYAWFDKFLMKKEEYTLPVIRNVRVAQAKRSSVTVTWNTDKPAAGQLEYGITKNYGTITDVDEREKEKMLTKNHRVSVDDLNPGTLYHFRVRSKDINGNDNMSGDAVFTTKK